jgi:3-oxoacyl-[acyl-carrier-protein] synthase-1
MPMTTTEPVIVGIGLVCPVGLSAPEAAAAVRSASMRFTETSIRDRDFSPFKLGEVPDDGLPPAAKVVERTVGISDRELRLVRLATMPLLECLAVVPLGQRPFPLILALPEVQPVESIDGPRVLRLLIQQAGGRLDAERSSAVDVGRAGGLLSIARAGEMIRAGHTDFAVAGGVDTYRDLYVLARLELDQRVKTATQSDGFIPSEGAAFVVLASASAADRSGLRPLARVSRATQSVEAGHLYSTDPYRGDGLAAAITQLVGLQVVTEPFAAVWSSMNGESHWAKEWGVSFLRNRAAFRDDHGTYHPADCTGDTGAACGPLMVVLAALGARDGYYRSPALVYCSSDRGLRSALAVSNA